MGYMKASAIDRDNQLREDIGQRIDSIISSAYAAHEALLKGQFEEALSELEDIPGPCKRAIEWLGELGDGG